MTDIATQTRSNAVQSVERAGLLLHALMEAPNPLTVLELSRVTGLNRTIAHRLVRTLQQQRMVSEVGSGRFDLGPALALLGNAFLDRQAIRRVALPYMIDLNNRVIGDRPWVVALAIPVGGEAVVLDRMWQQNAPLNSILDVGTRMPFTGSANGRCILSTYPDDEVVEVIGAKEAERMRSRLAEIRARGFVDFAHSEIRPGINAIAAAIRTADGRAAGAIAVSGVHMEAEMDEGSQLASHVSRTAQVIAAALPRQYR